ncbi:MAG: hypothetical protein ACPGAE_09985 [Neptuniibacter sp.]
MNKVKVLLALSLLANIYMIFQMYRVETTNNSIIFKKRLNETPEIGVLHKEECPIEVTANRICSIEIVEKRSDFALLKIQYHYVKGDEGYARIAVKANKGTHDNTVGTRGSPHLMEGSHTVLIPFGLYRADTHQKETPYISEFIVVRAQGISKNGKRYITPHIFETFIKYKYAWYAEGENVSWK